MEKIAIGCDHGGYKLKEAVAAHLREKGYEVEDLGCYSTESVDYQEYGHAVGHAVQEGRARFGIVICSTGIGISIAANKVKGIRCALCTNEMMARLTRQHNDSNVLALGAFIVGEALAKSMVDIFLTTDFSGVERHQRRIDGIEEVSR